MITSDKVHGYFYLFVFALCVFWAVLKETSQNKDLRLHLGIKLWTSHQEGPALMTALILKPKDKQTLDIQFNSFSFPRVTHSK